MTALADSVRRRFAVAANASTSKSCLERMALSNDAHVWSKPHRVKQQGYFHFVLPGPISPQIPMFSSPEQWLLDFWRHGASHVSSFAHPS
eukprot:TRINITY_DN3187_c0_g2_i1.p1 TRINITY_DN3187_c0_g2~~TRINITY_DN3187_c0_g2_i1.p1  ORF type:complete len:101 (-),score=8.21 TRINITY_DN3187_c0_g2_i1:218-487(-)